MVFGVPGTAEALLAARVLFAVVLGTLAAGNLLDLSGTIAYAESKGAPVASMMVPTTTLVLLAGAVVILVGAYPVVGALAVLGFMLGVTPVMHDFWNAEGMDRQNERFHFLKNMGLAAGALAFFAISGVPWPYAVGVGVW